MPSSSIDGSMHPVGSFDTLSTIHAQQGQVDPKYRQTYHTVTSKMGVKDLFLSRTPPKAPTSRCKVYPDDPEWPSEQAWSELNKLVDVDGLAVPNNSSVNSILPVGKLQRRDAVGDGTNGLSTGAQSSSFPLVLTKI